MEKINYDKIMQEQINGFTCKPRLLLHSCCAPCSSAVLERLSNVFDITIFYFNPNIYPKEEYDKRSNTQKKLVSNYQDIKLIISEYNEQEFLNRIKGLEFEKEGGARCPVCFALRLEETAKYAKQNNYDYFGTTLTISPHKNEQQINQIGKTIQDKFDVKFLFSDFKKHEGYKRSIELSKKYELYRQNYCGCRFSQYDGE